MSNLDDLYKSLGVFQQGMQKLAINQGIQEATAQVDQLNQSAMSALEKRQQQNQIAQSLALRLSQAGADANQITQTVGAIQPPQIKSSQDAYALGVQSGDQEMLGLASKMQGFETKAQRDQLAQQQSFQSGENSKNRAHEEKLKSWDLAQKRLELGMKIGEDASKKKAGDVSFDTNINMGLQFTKELKDAVATNGTWESDWFGDEKTAATLKGVPYQLAITYAKIVDPDSVAREGEVQAAQKYLIDLGITSNKKAVLAQIERMESTIKQYSQTRGEAKGGQPAAAAAPKGTPATIRVNGKLIKGIKLPNGDFQASE